MAGKQAKILFDHHIQALLAYATASRYPVRNRVIVLLSVKAGLRAGEIANLTWPMVLDPGGEISTYIELHDVAAKMRSGRRVPLHNDLREALARWHEMTDGHQHVVYSERGAANIAFNAAMILPYDSNPATTGFSERTHFAMARCGNVLTCV